jgi:eukaryotic-like serine/threonine-protein kinase
MESPGGRRLAVSGTDATVITGGDDDAAPSDDHSALSPGMMVGEYRIEGALGQGGMGRVYSAVHPVIAKRAAIKVLHPELSVNKEAVARFVQEARAVNEIGHPNIVDIFAFGTLADGRNYFVMEWLRGESLRDRIKRGPLPVTEALAILETITNALDAAHEHGIVHRDLKPDNVFLVDVKGERPLVKLLDFGIAKLTRRQGVQRTQTGNLLGTPAYMSPEQARAQDVDHRTDIYALGAMTFELLTGETVFEASYAADMIAKHLYESPRSATALNPTLPPIDGLLAAMLAKEAARRPTLEQVRGELRRYRVMAGDALTPPPGTLLTGGSMTPVADLHGTLPAFSSGVAVSPHVTAPAAAVPAIAATAATARLRGWPTAAIGLVVVAAILAGIAVYARDNRARNQVQAPAEIAPVETTPRGTATAVTPPVETPSAELAAPTVESPSAPAVAAQPNAESGRTQADDEAPGASSHAGADAVPATSAPRATTPTRTKPKRKTVRSATERGAGPYDPDAPM